MSASKDTYDERLAQSKNLKIAVICLGEMGHFLPCIQLSDELVSRGHDVYFITGNYNKEKCLKQINGIEVNQKGKGCTPVITKEDIPRRDMLPGSKKRADGKLGSEVWTEYVKDELRSIQPHLVVVDMLTCSGFDAADALKIPVVVNCPGPFSMFGLMG